MKRTISVASIAALFAIVSAFAARPDRQVETWNVDHPFQGNPGIYRLTALQIKSFYCPGPNNVECAYLVGSMGTIIKKPF